MVKKKKKNTFPLALVIAIAALALFWLVGGGMKPAAAPANPSTFDDLLSVRTNPSLRENLLHYKAMDVSFNPQRHIPNWSAWELTAEETRGDVARTNSFSSDPNVEGCAETWDYSYSGYDRGHLAPAGDMKWDKQAMAETFLLTNITPQDKKLNTGAWRTLEEKCRAWARADSAIYIVCGPVPDSKPKETIGDTHVWVPRRFFKVIIAPYASPARGIGFIMPNSQVKGGMQPCAVSIDSVEALTGHDFFHNLPDDLEADLESQCNFNQWSRVK